MSLKQGLFLTVLASALVACGGGGDGYYSDSNDNNNTPTTPNTDLNEAQTALKLLKREGQFLFGAMDNLNANQDKGAIDHALDTFGNGVMTLAIAVQSKLATNVSSFTYYETCHTAFEKSEPDSSQPASIPTTPAETPTLTDSRGCYVIHGNAIKTLLGSAYQNWDFDLSASDLKDLKPNGVDLNAYIGQTSVIIYKNQNTDKNLNDIVVTGKFSYPYLQSWNLNQSAQIRYVTIPDSDGSIGGFNLYNDPTSRDGHLYVVQADSSYAVLTNDNPNTPNIEPVTFTVNSTPGNQATTLRIKNDLTQILDLPNVTILNGQRIENEMPNINQSSISGSIYMEALDVFKFIQTANGSVLKFKNNLTVDANGVSIKLDLNGSSTNNNGKISSVLTAPTAQTLNF